MPAITKAIKTANLERGSVMPNPMQDLGWKFFFGALGLLQALCLAFLIKTDTTLNNTARDVQEVKQRQLETIIPQVEKHDRWIHDHKMILQDY